MNPAAFISCSYLARNAHLYEWAQLNAEPQTCGMMEMCRIITTN
jgi:hypothetical protein